MNRKYTLKRQLEDERDLQFAVAKTAELPSKIDLRENCPPVFDQGNIGSCTANAGTAAYMMTKGVSAELSRLFLYYEERRLEGTTSEDAGANMRSIGKALNKVGICEETLWPYIEENFDDDPPEAADNDAITRNGVAYKKLSSVTAIKQYLAKYNRPVMIGIEVYDSFEGSDVEQSGIVPLPDTGKEDLLGGHAVLIVGYDDDFGETHKPTGILSDLVDGIVDKLTGTKDEDGYFIVRNSWGADWGDDGYFYLPYGFVKKYAFDFWVLE